METKLTNLTSIAAFAQYVHEHHRGNEYTEYEGSVFPSVEVAYMICSRSRNRDEWNMLAKLPPAELEQKLKAMYPTPRSNSATILEKILSDKICGCKALRKEFLSEHESAYVGEFGQHLRAIYQQVKKADGYRR